MSESTVAETTGLRNLDRETAGLLRRGIATLVDGLIFSPLIVVIALPYIYSAAGLAEGPFSAYRLAWWRQALGLALAFAYGLLMLGRYGRTVGMMALRIRVTNLDGSGIGYGKALTRTAAYFLPSVMMAVFAENALAGTLIFAGYTIGLLWIMVDRAHQGYHDKIAGTLVMLEWYYQARRSEGRLTGSEIIQPL